jgi:Fic family protein
VAVGVATGNLALWIALGIVFGVVFDASNARKSGGNAENDARGAEKDAAIARVLAEARKKETITNDDVQAMLAVSDATAERYLQELETAGKIVQVGRTGKTVSYKII